MSRIFTSVSQLVGGTPLLELCRTEREEGLKARVRPEDVRVGFVPTEADLEKARAFGRSFAEQIKG